MKNVLSKKVCSIFYVFVKKISLSYLKGLGPYMSTCVNHLKLYGTFQPSFVKLKIGLKNKCEKSFLLKKSKEAVVKI